MSGISDLPLRMLCRRFGCELAFVEMLNCRSLSHKSKRTKSMLATDKEDKPLGVQILGCEPKFILKALDVLKKYAFDILDFNAACPAKKVVRRGEGASLLREPKKLQELLKLVVKNTALPVTVKIRTGWDDTRVNAPEVALRAQDAGIAALFIHGRTCAQGYGGKVDYSVIRRVKEALQIPVIASGNAFSAELIKQISGQTGCDAVAIARGALGNPWIFSGEKPSLNELVKIMLEHLQASVDFYGERVGVVKFRKFFSCYTKGMRRVRPLRERFSRARAQIDAAAIIESLKL